MYDLLIIGSGISSLSFLSSFKPKKRKIGIIFYEDKSYKKNLNPINNFFNKKDLPPRFLKTNKNINNVENFFKKNNLIVENDLSIFGSLSQGGVSDYWGNSLQFLNKSQIDFLSKNNASDLNNAFRSIYLDNNFFGCYNIKNKNDKFIKYPYKKHEFLKFDNKSYLSRFYTNCVAKNFKNNLDFIPKNITNQLNLKIKKMNYFVSNIRKRKGFFEIKCQNNKIIKILKSKKIVLAAGTISSTRLVCDMMNYKDTIKINHNPMLFGCFLSKSSFEKNNAKISAANLAVEITSKKLKNKSLANLRGSSKTIKNKIIENYFFMNNFISKKIYDLLSKKLIFVNLYLDSDYSNLYFKYYQKKSTIYSKPKINKKINLKLFEAYSQLYKSLRKMGLIYPFKFRTVPNLGTDNHFMGTIPISKKKKTLTLNENCELKGYKNFYIIDGCCLPKNNLKFPTGLIIANAYRIGKLL